MRETFNLKWIKAKGVEEPALAMLASFLERKYLYLSPLFGYLKLRDLLRNLKKSGRHQKYLRESYAKFNSDSNYRKLTPNLARSKVKKLKQPQVVLNKSIRPSLNKAQNF